MTTILNSFNNNSVICGISFHIIQKLQKGLCLCMCDCVKACRGNELDSGVEVADATGEPAPAQRIPIEADFLYAYSTTPGLSLCLSV